MADDQAVNQYLAFSGFYGPNKYSPNQDQPIALPTYAGTPTDAMGNPIAPPQGTTLNSAPAAAAPQQAAAAAAPPLTRAQQNQIGSYSGQPPAPYNLATTPEGMPAGQTSLGRGVIGSVWQQPPAAQPAQPAATPQAQGQAPGTMDYLTARSMLANPGKVTTPGANGPSPLQQPSVLQNFLANNHGGTGAGNYSNQGFFQTLNALKGATQPGAG